MSEYEGWEEEDMAGTRELPSQRCLDMDWSNAKEITAWEIAWCIFNNNIDFTAQKISEERKKEVEKQYIILKEEGNKQRISERVQELKDNIHEKHAELNLDACKTPTQVKCVNSLLSDTNTKKFVSYIKGDFIARDSQNYSSHALSYQNNLEAAYAIHKQYADNFTDREAAETVDFLFKQLLDLGLPRPFTEEEAKKTIITKSFYNALTRKGLATTPANKLAKQLTKIHFPGRSSGKS